MPVMHKIGEEPFELDVREAQQTVQVFCGARIVAGGAINNETVKSYYLTAETIQREAHALEMKRQQAREAARNKKDGIKP